MNYRKKFIVKPGSKVKLTKIDASFKDKLESHEHINNFERMLYENGTHILKFYLHIDPEEQLERFNQRIEDLARRWKISEGDYAERPYWEAFRALFTRKYLQVSTK